MIQRSKAAQAYAKGKVPRGIGISEPSNGVRPDLSAERSEPWLPQSCRTGFYKDIENGEYGTYVSHLTRGTPNVETTKALSGDGTRNNPIMIEDEQKNPKIINSSLMLENDVPDVPRWVSLEMARKFFQVVMTLFSQIMYIISPNFSTNNGTRGSKWLRCYKIRHIRVIWLQST